MTGNKRFRLAWENFDGWAILDTTGEYSDDEDYIDWLSGQKAVDVLNDLNDENEQLKQQLRNSVELFRKDSVALFELKEENKELKVNYKELRYANNIYCNKIDSLKKENEQLKIKLEDIALDMENAKESNDDAQYELYKIKKEDEKLKNGMIEVVDRYIRNVEHNPPSSTRTYLKVKGALNNVREGLRDLLGDLE